MRRPLITRAQSKRRKDARLTLAKRCVRSGGVVGAAGLAVGRRAIIPIAEGSFITRDKLQVGSDCDVAVQQLFLSMSVTRDGWLLRLLFTALHFPVRLVFISVLFIHRILLKIFLIVETANLLVLRFQRSPTSGRFPIDCFNTMHSFLHCLLFKSLQSHVGRCLAARRPTSFQTSSSFRSFHST